MPQSPLIHFQPEASGVSLRATEVKPKLDAFLIMRYQKVKGEQVPEDWYNPAAKAQKLPALDYKLRIEQQKLRSDRDLGFRTDDIFYGNMWSEEEKRKPRSEPLTAKKGLMIEEKMTVICFNSDLRDWIEESVGEFFIVTNFGTMQNKGFGSFLVQGKDYDYDAKEIANLLTMYSGAEHCYSFNSDKETVFKKIKMMYSVIKSGVNLGEGKGKGGENYIDSILFDYFQKLPKPIDHEKAFVKASKVAPAVKKVGTTKKFNKKRGKEVTVPLFNVDSVPAKENPNYRYVRALFGIGETVTYNDVNVPSGDTRKVTVKIEHDYKADNMKEKEKIARFPSPVFFKIIKNNVYFVGMPIEDVIFGKTFVFSAKGRGKVSVKVPQKSELPADFINDFMEYAFTQLTDFISKRTNESAFELLKGVSLRRVV